MAQESAMVGSFRFNAHAPEFVPSPKALLQPYSPFSGYFCPRPTFPLTDAVADWYYMGGDPESMQLMCDSSWDLSYDNSILPNDLRVLIIKKVEYLLSDMSLLANESSSKYVTEDLEGYVPISVIASTKKIKPLITDHLLLAQALRSSPKLVVTSDGKKVKRKQLDTDKDKEEQMTRTVVAENLPEDHSHENIENIFNVVGKIKSLRLCSPPESNCSRLKGDFVISNKLHALIEYENAVVAEKAVEKLNDEGNWRKGLRVRTLYRCSPRSVLKGRRSDFDRIMSDDERSNDSSDEYQGEDFSPRTKIYGRGRGKGRGKGRGLNPEASSSPVQCDTLARKCSTGPRMPDGTKGFTLGRGKPIATLV